MQLVDQKPGIRILNYIQGDVVCHPLVLLAGTITDQGSNTTGQETSLQTSDNSVSGRPYQVQVLEATSTRECSVYSNPKESTLLVRCKDHEMSWPVVEGGFKVVVPLAIGENLISLNLKETDSENISFLELKLTYTPLSLSRLVRVVYVKCADSDGSFDAPVSAPCDLDSAAKRLSFNARLLQTFTAESLFQHGLGRKTFRLEEDESGFPKVHIFTSKLTSSEALNMSGNQLYDTFSKELECSSLYDPMCKFWTFMSCTHYDPPPVSQFDEKLITKYVKAHTALGGGYFALFGTGGLHTWASSIDELVACFTDTRHINKLELFDDSGGRGTYWANYATGLGASMHELGHCFDLAHTPKGIMSRGFDDMNAVWTLWRKPPSVQDDLLLSGKADFGITEETSDKALTAFQVSTTGHPNVGGLVPASGTSLDRSPCSLAPPNNWSHGAHWYRSSAVLLSYHKWFSNSEDGSSLTKPMVHWCHRVCGPVGNCGDSCQKDQYPFNSVKWLRSQGASLGGFVIHTSEYVNCLQIIGNTEDLNSGKCQEVMSEPHGTDGVGRRCTFIINSPDEYITAVDVRAGGWIDAIRLHTNQKSSVWMGGTGGDEYHLRAPPGKTILGIMGTSGTFVGSLGLILSSDSSEATTDKADNEDHLLVQAAHGIRLIELWDKTHSEVCQHWEFLQSNPPTTFMLSRTEVKEKASTVLVEDDKGNLFRAGFAYDYSEVIC
ncbi:uncharacterized protein [Montipora foliosa]|uniref:uncharacterized protein n=1 Tax=Montipora foliosa TaxID=591990 RepID=UPI0035F1104D